MTQLKVNIILDGERFTIEANSSDCIEHVIDCFINDHLQGSADDIALSWSGKNLEVNRSLADFNVRDGATLQATRQNKIDGDNNRRCDGAWWLDLTLKLGSLGDCGLIICDIVISSYSIWTQTESPRTVMTFLKAVFDNLFFTKLTAGGAVGAATGVLSFALLSNGIDSFFPSGVPGEFVQMNADLASRMRTLKETLEFLPSRLHFPNIEPVLELANDFFNKISAYHSSEINRARCFCVAACGAAVGTGVILAGCTLGPFGLAAVLVWGLVTTYHAGSACCDSYSHANEAEGRLAAIKSIKDQLNQMRKDQ